MYKSGLFLSVLAAAIFCLIRCAAAYEEYCYALGSDNVRSYKAEDKIPFYKKYDDEKTMHPTGAYIAQGSYFLAAKQKDGTYCAIYMPDGKNYNAGIEGFIKAENFSETEGSEYNALPGSWIYPETEKAYGGFLKIYRAKDGAVFMFRDDRVSRDMNSYKPLSRADAVSLILKTGKENFMAMAGRRALKPAADGLEFTDFGGISYKYLRTEDCSQPDEIIGKIPWRDSKDNIKTDIHEGEPARAYKAGETVQFYKSCAAGLCPTGHYIAKGGYFIAAKRRDGLYCALSVKENGDKAEPSAGFIQGRNFAETQNSEYASLFKLWESVEGKWPSENSVWKIVKFKTDGKDIIGSGTAQSPSHDKDSSNSKEISLSAVGSFSGAAVMKTGAFSFLIATENGFHYAVLKGKKLILDGDYNAEAKARGEKSGFSGEYSVIW